MKWKNKIEKLMEWKEKDNKRQKALDCFGEVFSPDCYPLIINETLVQAYIEGIAQDNKEIKDWLEYLVYEVSQTTYQVWDKDKVEYDFRKLKDIVSFFEKHY
jgi:hypothetical protein